MDIGKGEKHNISRQTSPGTVAKTQNTAKKTLTYIPKTKLSERKYSKHRLK